MIRLLATSAAFSLVAGLAFAQQGNPGAHMMEQWDISADGQLTLEEARTKRGEIFYMFDAEGDGVLTAKDWAMVEQHIADEMGTKGAGQGAGMGMKHGAANGPGAAMHEAMPPAFNDSDGHGKVSLAEFEAATDALFAMLDRNGDGVVTTADFGRM